LPASKARCQQQIVQATDTINQILINNLQRCCENDDVDSLRTPTLEALAIYTLKLSETTLRPVLDAVGAILDAALTDNNARPLITVYKLALVWARQLRVLFMLVAGRFVQRAADVLQRCNLSGGVRIF
jgi:hypothetical protein